MIDFTYNPITPADYKSPRERTSLRSLPLGGFFFCILRSRRGLFIYSSSASGVKSPFATSSTESRQELSSRFQMRYRLKYFSPFSGINRTASVAEMGWCSLYSTVMPTPQATIISREETVSASPTILGENPPAEAWSIMD